MSHVTLSNREDDSADVVSFTRSNATHISSNNVPPISPHTHLQTVFANASAHKDPDSLRHEAHLTKENIECSSSARRPRKVKHCLRVLPAVRVVKFAALIHIHPIHRSSPITDDPLTKPLLMTTHCPATDNYAHSPATSIRNPPPTRAISYDSTRTKHLHT